MDDRLMALEDELPEGGEDDPKRPTSVLEETALFARLRKQFRASQAHFAKWRQEAKEDYGFVAGDQWTPEEMSVLREQMRPVITFNRIDPVISAVSGTEVSNRQEVRYLPREAGDAGVDEVATNAAKWFRDQCDAEDEESDAFMDTLICGVGATETRLDFEIDPEGAPVTERIDPFELYPDPASRKRNYEDGRRVFRVRKMPREDALALVGDLPDEDEIDASWALADDMKDEKETQQEARFYRGGDAVESGSDEVTLVECQWWERETVHQVADPATGKIAELNDKDFKVFAKRAPKLGMPVQSVTMTKRVYKRAYLGKASVLLIEDSPFKEHFSYKFITGKRDRNAGTFYGLVRMMKDPQRWANKWLSQTLHIMNTNAKGGVMAEKGVAYDEREFEKTWARPDAVTWLNQGALTGQNGEKIQPKPGAQLPAGYFNLLEFAISSVRDASGVNLELLGMKENEQAGVLEAQRKRQAMAILATMFDSLRRYRKSQGRLLLFIIQNYLNDGRLIRIVGDEGEQYVPMLLNGGVSTYDVKVDDAPSSPQQKELTWGVLSQILPVVKDQVTPEMWAVMLQYAPLPTSVVTKMQGLIQSGQESRQQASAEQAEIAKAGQIAEVEKTKSEAFKNVAQAQSAMQPDPAQMQPGMDAQGQPAVDPAMVEAFLKRQIEDEDRQRKLQWEAEDRQINQQMAREKHQAELARMRAETRIKSGGVASADDIESGAEMADPLETQVSGVTKVLEALAQHQMSAEQRQAMQMERIGQLLEVVAAPRRVELTRDATGRATGGVSIPDVRMN
jgi:hypothetical protein